LLTSLLTRTVAVRPQEIKAMGWAFAYFFCLLSSYYILRPLRDEMGVAGGVRNLQWMFTATFVTMLAVIPLFAWLVSRFPRRVFVPWVYRFFVLNILIFFAALTLTGSNVWVARAFFVWVSVFNLFVVTVFWSFMADLFSSEQGKRLYGFIAAGGTCWAR
jgi:AAA family ATP:ADP antiporter